MIIKDQIIFILNIYKKKLLIIKKRRKIILENQTDKVNYVKRKFYPVTFILFIISEAYPYLGFDSILN